MNYYPFHIGDYLSATRHLSWEEDAAYRRLLDTYYISEKPLPADLKAICRLVLAATESQRQAVATVLEEFFELADEGWINRRADAEIVAMRDKRAACEERISNERERMRRHRERRSELFEALHQVGVTTNWDIPMTDLQRLYNAHCHRPATDLKREQSVTSNADATAIPTPTPTPTPEDTPSLRSGGKPEVAKPEDVAEPVWEDFRRLRRAKKAPITATALAGLRREAEKAGISLEQALSVCCEAGWQGFRADWYGQRTGKKTGGYHHDLSQMDYTRGVDADGRF